MAFLKLSVCILYLEYMHLIFKSCFLLDFYPIINNYYSKNNKKTVPAKTDVPDDL